MRHRKTLALAALLVAVTTGVSSCSSHSAETSTTPSTAATVAGVSATDVAFAQSMIPHHEQAIEMADLALAPAAAASPEVTALAEQIKDAQDPEIAQMTAWLQEWGAPLTMPGADEGMDDMDHGGHDMGDITMSGMMSAEDMQALREAKGQEFDTQWLQMMIAHHEGAVVMAEQVKVGTDDPRVDKLAAQVIVAQKNEILEMQSLLAP